MTETEEAAIIEDRWAKIRAQKPGDPYPVTTLIKRGKPDDDEKFGKPLWGSFDVYQGGCSTQLITGASQNGLPGNIFVTETPDVSQAMHDLLKFSKPSYDHPYDIAIWLPPDSVVPQKLRQDFKVWRSQNSLDFDSDDDDPDGHFDRVNGFPLEQVNLRKIFDQVSLAGHSGFKEEWLGVIEKVVNAYEKAEGSAPRRYRLVEIQGDRPDEPSPFIGAKESLTRGIGNNRLYLHMDLPRSGDNDGTMSRLLWTMGDDGVLIMSRDDVQHFLIRDVPTKESGIKDVFGFFVKTENPTLWQAPADAIVCIRNCADPAAPHSSPVRDAERQYKRILFGLMSRPGLHHQ